MDKLDFHFNAHRNNILELFNIEWPPGMYFSDFETTCRQQGLHCDFAITFEQAIVMMTAVKTSNQEIRNEVIRKNGDLKSVRKTAKAFEVPKEGIKMINTKEAVAKKSVQHEEQHSKPYR